MSGGRQTLEVQNTTANGIAGDDNGPKRTMSRNEIRNVDAHYSTIQILGTRNEGADLTQGDRPKTDGECMRLEQYPGGYGAA